MTNLSSYQDVSAHGALADASSHEVITQMYRTALTRIAEAKGSIERGEIGKKGEQIGKALAIVEGLLFGTMVFMASAILIAVVADLVLCAFFSRAAGDRSAAPLRQPT